MVVVDVVIVVVGRVVVLAVVVMIFRCVCWMKQSESLTEPVPLSLDRILF